jgi:hypothetical protein
VFNFIINNNKNFFKNSFINKAKPKIKPKPKLPNLNLTKKLQDTKLYFLKKYIYTINHKRIALNYLYFTA